ncbi:MAG: hypothetical protein L3J43_05450 [Sulfurovum sp.]|nr:hypothetical protein [Sulfurovum sp.]
MQKITMKAYAVQHKLSIFNVMKMVKSGTLKSETVEEDGKEILYILLDDETEETIKKGIVSLTNNAPHAKLEADIRALQSEVQILRKEIETLKNRL